MIRRGFTLIEIMVAVSIFAIVAIIAVSALLTANRLNQKAQAIKLVMDNLNFAVDSMAFKLRRGGNYYCITTDPESIDNPTLYNDHIANNCQNGGQAISLWSLGGGTQFIYRLHQEGDRGSLQVRKADQTGWVDSDWVYMTIADLDLEELRFYVFNAPIPPAVSAGALGVHITLKGQARAGKETSDFALQTTISERK
jgi:prepilin-type N-terminal cleavage/methylation domain-containing protein